MNFQEKLFETSAGLRSRAQSIATTVLARIQADIAAKRVEKRLEALKGSIAIFKQKTAYEIIAGDWSSDVCSSDLRRPRTEQGGPPPCDSLRGTELDARLPGARRCDGTGPLDHYDADQSAREEGAQGRCQAHAQGSLESPLIVPPLRVLS